MTHGSAQVEIGRGCWSPKHWLHECEGFQVWSPGQRVGYVEGVLERGGRVQSLLVRVGEERFSELVVVPAEIVASVDPIAERVDVVAGAWRTGEQLTLSAL